MGVSTYGLLCWPYDIEEFFKIGYECGLRNWHTRVWLINARPEDFEGYFDAVLLDGNGRYNLRAPNPAFYERLRFLGRTANKYQCRPVFDIMESYSWTSEKGTLPGVPDRDRHYLRHNNNNVRYGHPSDDTWYVEEWSAPAQPYGGPLPGWFIEDELMPRAVDALDGCEYEIEPYNEGKEKRIHFEMAARAYSLDVPGCQVNRNEDTPGQAFNMQVIGTNSPRFDRISHHGWKDLQASLDEEYPEEAGAGRPTTFRKLFETGWGGKPALGESERRKFILSSDGSRNSWSMQPYDLPKLLEIAEYAMRRLGGFEHQEGLKMAYYTGQPDPFNVRRWMNQDFIRALAALQR